MLKHCGLPEPTRSLLATQHLSWDWVTYGKGFSATTFHLIQEFSLVYFINYTFKLHFNPTAPYIQPQDVEFTCSAVNVKRRNFSADSNQQWEPETESSRYKEKCVHRWNFNLLSSICHLEHLYRQWGGNQHISLRHQGGHWSNQVPK